MTFREYLKTPDAKFGAMSYDAETTPELLARELLEILGCVPETTLVDVVRLVSFWLMENDNVSNFIGQFLFFFSAEPEPYDLERLKEYVDTILP